MSWLEKKTGPAAKEVKTTDEVDKLKEEKEVIVLGLFKDQSSDAAKEFVKAAEANDDNVFAITSEKAVFDALKVKKDEAVVLLKTFDSGRDDFAEDKIEAEAVNKFARTNALPLVSEFSPETAGKIFGTDVKVHFLLLAAKDSDVRNDRNLGYRNAGAKSSLPFRSTRPR